MTATYQLPDVVSHQNVEDVLSAGSKVIDQLSQGDSLTMDCQLLKTFDSSALSAILSFKRMASKRSITIHLSAVPEKLASLAKVYDLADIVLS